MLANEQDFKCKHYGTQCTVPQSDMLFISKHRTELQFQSLNRFMANEIVYSANKAATN